MEGFIFAFLLFELMSLSIIHPGARLPIRSIAGYFFGVPGPMKNHTIRPTNGNRATITIQRIFLTVSAELLKIRIAA